MALKIYDESVINNFRTKYNYKLFSNNKLIVNRASVIVTKNLLDNLKIIESYEKIFAGRNERLILEPGRSISANAGIMLTRVEYKKNDFPESRI